MVVSAWDAIVPKRSVQLKPQKHSVAACRKILEGYILAISSRPFYTAVRRAFIQKFARWYVSTQPTKQAIAPEALKKLEHEWTRLAELLSPRPPSTQNHMWTNLQVQPQIVRVLRHAWRANADHAGRGRPRSDLRRLAVQALDLRHADSKRWTWREIAMHFGIYKCSEAGHDPQCQKEWETYLDPKK